VQQKIKRREPAAESGRYTSVLGRLKLGVGVRADFAVEVDLFVLRGNPFHEQCSLKVFNDKRKDSMGSPKTEEGKNP